MRFDRKLVVHLEPYLIDWAAGIAAAAVFVRICAISAHGHRRLAEMAAEAEARATANLGHEAENQDGAEHAAAVAAAPVADNKHGENGQIDSRHDVS